ncbi:DUF883 family protein [Nitrincola alkalilacustris]|uniref:DUF883 family protein n=1 Tax=Nitrincola alkalilacustris TaxID=1571224 RepID=UPI00124E09B8|nr:DUF883 family protein [Nitrincola alkalilacustris]
MGKEKVIKDVTKEQLFADFRRVVADAEALVKATVSHGGEEMDEVRAAAEESLKVAKARLADEGVDLMDKTKDTAKATDAYIHDNPWQAIGIAAGVGLLVGLLSGRR